MKKFVFVLITIALLATAFFNAIEGYRYYQIFGQPQGSSEAIIHLDKRGTFAVTLDPPGESLFRPGGVLEIFVTRDGIPVHVEQDSLGRGSLRVTDSTGRVCLELALEEFEVTHYFGEERFYGFPREFDTPNGGPYLAAFEVTEPFRGLEGTVQTLTARHFTSGKEPLIHCVHFGITALSGGFALILIWRNHMQKKTDSLGVLSKNTADIS